MTFPTSDPQFARPCRAEAAWLIASAIVLGALLAVLAQRSGARLVAAAAAASRGLSEPAAARILRTSGISAELVQAVRAGLPDGGRLLLYSPYGGQQFVLDAADPRGEMARQVRGMWGRLKNLIYPRPRDVGAVYDSAELLAHVDAGMVGRLLVLDGTQGTEPLAVGGDYELLHEERLGDLRMRLWRLQGVR